MKEKTTDERTRNATKLLKFILPIHTTDKEHETLSKGQNYFLFNKTIVESAKGRGKYLTTNYYNDFHYSIRVLPRTAYQRNINFETSCV